jgi:TatA/E family protein of Tat protein translocase
MPFNIGPGELIIVLIIALIVLGPGKLPDVASSLGKSLREFRKAATDVSDATRIDAPPVNPAAPIPPASPTVSSSADAVSTPAAPAAPNPLSGAADPNTLQPAEPARDSDHA